MFFPLVGLVAYGLVAERDMITARISAEKDRPFGVAVLNLDAFQHINEAFGFEFGDDALRAVGERLAGSFGSGAHVARVGGDEFGLLVEENLARTPDRIARRLRATFEEPFVVHGEPLTIEAGAGLALYPGHGAEAALLRWHDPIHGRIPPGEFMPLAERTGRASRS